MTGTTIAQAIPIAASPILSRIYTPEDYGVFALFVAITSIFGSISAGRYELAIMLPEEDEDAINIFALGFIITSILSFTLLILIILFQKYFVRILDNEEIGYWLYFIPLTVFFTGFYNLLNFYNIRSKKFKDISAAIIIKVTSNAIVQISIGFVKAGFFGLISGQIISQALGNSRLLKNIIKDRNLISKVSKISIVRQAKRYKDFPKYSMAGALANTLTVSLINILLPFLFSLTSLGFYSLVQRVLGMPMTLMGNAIGQVFLQKATIEKKETGLAKNIFNSTIKKLIIISLPVFIVIYLTVEDVFAFVFGADWEISGVYAKIMIPFFLIRFISSPLSNITTVFEKQKSGLLINIILLISSLIILGTSYLLSIEFIDFIMITTYIMTFNYLMFLLYYKKIANGS